MLAKSRIPQQLSKNSWSKFMMSQIQETQLDASQNFTLPDGKIVISRAQLCEILQLLSMTTPLVGAPRPPERHWSAIKSMKLYRAKKLLRRALADGNSQRGNV
jgi:hypothetical protein